MSSNGTTGPQSRRDDSVQYLDEAIDSVASRFHTVRNLLEHSAEQIRMAADLAAEVSSLDVKHRIKESGFFDAQWYLRRYRDVARAQVDPLDHFVDHGRAELRSPGPLFDAHWYAREHADVLASGKDPLTHYLEIGREKNYAIFASSYDAWRAAFDMLEASDIEAILADSASGTLPGLHVVVWVSADSDRYVDQTLASLEDQLYLDWRATIYASPGCSASMIKRLREYADRNERFIFSIAPMPDADSSGHEKPETYLLVRAGVILRRQASYVFARAVLENPRCAAIYADEERYTAATQRAEPIFKPAYSPELAAESNYFGSCVLLTSVPSQIAALCSTNGHKRTAADLLRYCRFSEEKTSIGHIPLICYYDAKFENYGTPRESSSGGERTLASFSIIIPTRDRLELLQPCVDSIFNETAYPRGLFEVIVVDNGSVENETLNYLSQVSERYNVRVVRDDCAFNFSRLNNVAAHHAANDVLLFVNNDTVVNDSRWLRKISAKVTQHDVGAVGAKLLYPDGTIQHGGVILGLGGVAGHDLVGMQATDAESRLDVTREVSAVTGACLAMRREVFDRIGGFDEVAAVAFNDILLCMNAMRLGYRNVYLNDPLLIHFESKSRGLDDSPVKQALFQREARYARAQNNAYFKADRYYSPNLSLQEANELAYPPRCVKPWLVDKSVTRKRKVLLLSSSHELGHGVAVVVHLQAMHLRAAGFEVFVGGPKGERDLDYTGCERVYVSDARGAAIFAIRNAVDCIVAQTPPFFSIVRWLGESPPTIFLDYGEPPAELFPDARDRASAAAEKRLCFAMADKVFAISECVRAEGSEQRAGIIRCGNSHLAAWNDSLVHERARVRSLYGWSDCAVVLNVCRFRKQDQHYKGLDTFAALVQEFRFLYPALANRVRFVLCGKAEPSDILEMRGKGIEVFANISDARLAEMYIAADLYANFSRWEGYNLGIAQALAYGLPVIASDNPAHRAFGIQVANGIIEIVEKVSDAVKEALVANYERQRSAQLIDWRPSLEQLEAEIADSCTFFRSEFIR